MMRTSISWKLISETTYAYRSAGRLGQILIGLPTKVKLSMVSRRADSLLARCMRPLICWKNNKSSRSNSDIKMIAIEKQIRRSLDRLCIQSKSDAYCAFFNSSWYMKENSSSLTGLLTCTKSSGKFANASGYRKKLNVFKRSIIYF